MIYPGTSNVNGIRANIIDRVQDEITNDSDAVDRTQLTEDELRTLGGLLNAKEQQLEAVEGEVEYWEKRSENEVDARKKALYKSISDVAKLKADELRLRQNQRPTSDKVNDMIDSDDLTKFERLKKFARDNLGALSIVAISIAGIITTVVIAGRKGVVSAAKATGAVAKAVAKLAKSALPVIVPLINMLATALTWGAKGIAWLAQNLWMLAVAFAYLLYKNKKYLY